MESERMRSSRKLRVDVMARTCEAFGNCRLLSMVGGAWSAGTPNINGKQPLNKRREPGCR
jgi:hypothetical protein